MMFWTETNRVDFVIMISVLVSKQVLKSCFQFIATLKKTNCIIFSSLAYL